MKPPAFLARHRRAYDKKRNQNLVAKFKQARLDLEIPIVFVNFPIQIVDAVQGALQTLVGAHNADIVPHGAAKLLVVVLQNDPLVGIADIA